MTAAHCLANISPGQVKVVVGDHDTSTRTETNATVVHDVESFKIHENYDNASKNDIALIRLTKPIAYNEDVGPVCLPWKLTNENLANKPATLVGWGTTEFGGPKSKTLQEVDVSITTDARCEADHPGADKTVLCTYDDDKDSCQVRRQLLERDFEEQY